MSIVVFKHLKHLASRTPEQWMALLERMPYPLKHNVAAVVWWDMFACYPWKDDAGQPRSLRCFDDLLFKGRINDARNINNRATGKPGCPDSSIEDIKAGLVSLGYPEKEAAIRLRGNMRNRVNRNAPSVLRKAQKDKETRRIKSNALL